MRKVVIVQFEADRPQEFALHADEAPLAADQAREWLGEQFIANDCEPLRPSGKVLTADMVMALATTVGPAKFADPAWTHDFVKATVAALGRSTVRVDVYNGNISY